MGAVIIVVADEKAGEVGEVLFAHFGNHVFGRDALFLRGQHHGRAVGVVGAAVVALVAAQFLKAHPNVGLDVFDHVAEVDAAVGIGQRGGNEDFACHGLCLGKQWIKMGNYTVNRADETGERSSEKGGFREAGTGWAKRVI